MIGVATATTPGSDHLAQGRLGRDVDDAGVVRALGVVHDPGHLAELATDLDDDRLRRRADGADGERAEEVHEHRADEGGDEHVDVGEVDRVRGAAAPGTPASIRRPWMTLILSM